jgi:hypothetical protein
MHTKDLLPHRGRHGESVEDVPELAPELDGVPALALVVEAVDSVDGAALVVAAISQGLASTIMCKRTEGETEQYTCNMARNKVRTKHTSDCIPTRMKPNLERFATLKTR